VGDGEDIVIRPSSWLAPIHETRSTSLLAVIAAWGGGFSWREKEFILAMVWGTNERVAMTRERAPAWQ